jgi:V8-like Glu-specific endopeptidase
LDDHLTARNLNNGGYKVFQEVSGTVLQAKGCKGDGTEWNVAEGKSLGFLKTGLTRLWLSFNNEQRCPLL